jgi:hypothetical protein
MRFAAFLAFTLVAGTAVAEESSFLFDALQNRTYRASWQKLMKEVQPTPDWLLRFNRNYDGVASELKPVTIEGKAYRISFVCKPTECAGRRFEVLFDASGAHAYGALGGNHESPAFYGNPAPALQDVLAKAVKN